MPGSTAVPDVLRFLPEERPAYFDRLSDEQRRVRGRYYLMVWAMGASEPYAWFNALNEAPGHFEEIKAIVDGVEDAEILEALQTRNTPDRPVLPAPPEQSAQ